MISHLQTFPMLGLIVSAMIISVVPTARAAPASAPEPVSVPEPVYELPPDDSPRALQAKRANELLIRRGRNVALTSIAPLALVTAGAALIVFDWDFSMGISFGGCAPPPPPPPRPTPTDVGVALVVTGLVGSAVLLTTGLTMRGVGKHREKKRLHAGFPVPRGAGVGWALRF